VPRGHSHRIEGFPRKRLGRWVFPTTCRQTFYFVIRGRPLIPIHRALRIACRLAFGIVKRCSLQCINRR
jgi:hypothetical protein